MKTKALDRAVRKRQIIIWFAIRIQHDNLSAATSYEVAKGLGLSASQKLRAILNEMVSEGLLCSQPMNKQGRWKGSGYMLAAGTYSRPRRTIKITSRSGQMEFEF